jgi:hypothetical protein
MDIQPRDLPVNKLFAALPQLCSSGARGGRDQPKRPRIQTARIVPLPIQKRAQSPPDLTKAISTYRLAAKGEASRLMIQAEIRVKPTYKSIIETIPYGLLINHGPSAERSPGINAPSKTAGIAAAPSAANILAARILILR